MNSWKVNGFYDFHKLVNDFSVKAEYVYRNTKNYFRHFKQYFYEQNLLLSNYSIALPIEYPKTDVLLDKKADREYKRSLKKPANK